MQRPYFSYTMITQYAKFSAEFIDLERGLSLTTLSTWNISTDASSFLKCNRKKEKPTHEENKKVQTPKLESFHNHAADGAGR